MNSFFCDVLQKQSLTDVLENRCSQKFRKQLCWSLFLIKLQAKFLRTSSFTKHLQWLLLWFLQQNNLIFSVITINLGYNQKLSWKYSNYYHPPYIKYPYPIKSMPIQPCSPNILEPFPPESKLLDPLKHLFLYNFNIFVYFYFMNGGGVSHSYTVQLLEGPSKIDYLIYQGENSLLPQKCS